MHCFLWAYNLAGIHLTVASGCEEIQLYSHCLLLASIRLVYLISIVQKRKRICILKMNKNKVTNWSAAELCFIFVCLNWGGTLAWFAGLNDNAFFNHPNSHSTLSKDFLFKISHSLMKIYNIFFSFVKKTLLINHIFIKHNTKRIHTF